MVLTDWFFLNMIAIGIQPLLNLWAATVFYTVAIYNSSHKSQFNTNYWRTWSPPATSTSTAKLVRCVLRHCTFVVFPSVMLFPILSPSDSQLPWPALFQRRHNFMFQLKHKWVNDLRFWEFPVDALEVGCLVHLQKHTTSKDKGIHIYDIRCSTKSIIQMWSWRLERLDLAAECPTQQK